MPSSFPKEWIHSSYGLPGSIFNQLRNNNPSLNQENNSESSNNNNNNNNNQQENSTIIINPNNFEQERQRQVINEPTTLSNNQFSSIDEQNKISNKKYDNLSSHSSSLDNKTNHPTSINTRDNKNERTILKSAPSTNSIDSNHAVVDVPLFMENKGNAAEHYNAINDHDYGNLLPTKETTNLTTTHDDQQNIDVHNNLLPMGHNRDEENKVLPMNKNIIPGTFNSSIPLNLSNTTSSTENKNRIDNNENNEKENDHQDQYDTSFIDSSTEPAIASIIAGSAISTNKILNKQDYNDLMDSSITEKEKRKEEKEEDQINKKEEDQKLIDNKNDNSLEKMDTFHPLAPNEQNEITASSSDPSSTIDTFQFEKNNNLLNNDRRRKSLPADQCATALPVLGSYVPFAQGVAVTINNRERYNQESQRRASNDRRYSLNSDTVDHQPQNSETNNNTTTQRRKSSLTAGIEKLLHFRKKSK